MRIPTSAPKNRFFDGMNIDDQALTLEQNYNSTIQSGIINNHFGSGVLSGSLIPNILFDTAAISNVADGIVLYAQKQPSDPNSGVQLSVSLSNSSAAGKRTVKVIIIGLDFENNLQYDALVFAVNEEKITSKHYTQILAIVLNDFAGPTVQSFQLGGRLIIQEAKPFSLSRDPIMVSQDSQPNLFFRDFVVANDGTLTALLSNVLANYNIANLNINTNYKQLQTLVENDVSSQIGQKFLATTTNIQKITLLLSVINNSNPNNLVWTGDLLVSIYPLQSSVQCFTDVVPQLAIDFTPTNVPLAQLSVTYGSLQANGTVLNTVPQPVDFIFSNTVAGTGNSITAGNYYAITIKRAGSADTCQIQWADGTNASPNIRETLFNGSVWTDVPDASLWFRVWTDAAKVSDGQAYDAGEGVIIPKNQISTTTGATTDYVLNQLSFARNDLYFALAQSETTDLAPVQDPRTGNEIFSEQQFTPSINLFTAAGLANIQNVSDPLIIGTITDQNIKSYNAATATLLSAFHEYGFVDNQIVAKVITDPTDGYRYDTTIIELASLLVGGYLNSAKITPNISNPNLYYRIAKAEYITMIYGDVNGDGIVDENDILMAEELVGVNINSFPTYQQYLSDTTYFANDGPISWQLIDSNSNLLASGTDGFITKQSNGTLALFHSISTNFSLYSNLSTDRIVISGSNASPGNNGSFEIQNLVDNNDIMIEKVYYTSDTLLQILRTNITNSGIVSATDVQLITNYATLVPPFPATTLPGSRVGTPFSAIRLTLEEFIDRADDYPNTPSTRNALVHPLPDIFLDGYTSFAGQNVEMNPLSFSVTQQLSWFDYSIVVSTGPRLVPAAFTYQVDDGYSSPLSCDLTGIEDQTFPLNPTFDPGRNDIFIPNNLIMNFGGQLINPDGYTYYKVDFETANIVIEIPPVPFNGAKSVNVFTDLVADFTKTGRTRLGHKALQFSDCSFVEMDALQKNQVRFAVAMQSFSPQLNGTSGSLQGIIVDSREGISFDFGTGILTAQFFNTFQDPVDQTLNTKVQITVYLKKAGFNNTSTYIDSTVSQNWFGL